MSRIEFCGVVIALGILASAAPSSASPAPRGDDAFTVWGDQVEQILQHPAEPQDQFIQRAMQRMRTYTRETSHEVSGSLCTDQSGRMGISIFTWHAHLSAPYMAGCPLETPIRGDFVHTHPLHGSYVVTAQDAKSINRDRRFFKISSTHRVYLTATSAARFSPSDYRVGPGYLISDGDVFYQSGKGTARHVMTLPPLP